MHLRRKRSNWSILSYATTVWFSVSGAMSGVLLAAIILEEVAGPGHPYYLGIKKVLGSIFGVD